MRGRRFAAALFLVAQALRPQIIGVGPLIPAIQDDVGVSHTVAGLRGTIPVLCMGLFAPAAAYVAGALGGRTAIALSVGLIALGGLLRVVVPDPAVLIAFTPGSRRSSSASSATRPGRSRRRSA